MGRPRRTFGKIRKLPNGRLQASYIGPDGGRHFAPRRFQTKFDAEAWLVDRNREISRGEWVAEIADKPSKPVTFGEYADAWLADRTLKPRTREHYTRLLRQQINPTFAKVPLTAFTPHKVRAWHTSLGTATPTLRAHAYGLLRTILGEAVHDGEILSNPAHIRGAGNSKRVHKIKPASLPELEAIALAMPERYRLMVLLAAWCGLRFGELTELRRHDVDARNGVLRIRRAVVRADGETIVGTPKSDAGTRDVNIPPHLLPVVRAHLAHNITGGREGLLFPAASDPTKHLAPASLYRVYYRAREAAGRPDLRFHDLRHTGQVLAASTGATLAELMARLGHSTQGAALRYMHAAQDRDKAIAEALSALVPPPR